MGPTGTRRRRLSSMTLCAIRVALALVGAQIDDVVEREHSGAGVHVSRAPVEMRGAGPEETGPARAFTSPAHTPIRNRSGERLEVAQVRDLRPSVKRPAWLFSARARVSSQSAMSSKPSSRAVRAKPGYISVYS